jgi:hypothetical protein
MSASYYAAVLTECVQRDMPTVIISAASLEHIPFSLNR